MMNYSDLLEQRSNDFIKQVLNHPFIIRCQLGTVTKEELDIFLRQQGHYSSYFTRYLCALMSNLQNNNQVVELARNLFEETGFEGDGSSIPHSVIYRNMLNNFSISLNSTPINNETQNLIDTMFEYCKKSDPAYGLGALCLGAEALVPSLYSAIINGFNSCHVQDSLIEFFHLHVGCDDAHAETLHNMMVNIAKYNDTSMTNMLLAGQALIDSRMKFFDGIERCYAESMNHHLMI